MKCNLLEMYPTIYCIISLLDESGDYVCVTGYERVLCYKRGTRSVDGYSYGLWGSMCYGGCVL